MRRSSPNIPGILLAAGAVWSAIFWWAPLAGNAGAGAVRLSTMESPGQPPVASRGFTERDASGELWERVLASPDQSHSSPQGAPEGYAPGAGSSAQDQAMPEREPRYYIIRSGDRLETIARDVLGSRAAVQRLLDANPGIDPLRLRPGQRIRIPDD